MTRIMVDRLAVQAPGLTPEQARRLQRLLGDLLAEPGARPAAPAAPDHVDELARRIVAEITSELRRRV